jgi:archaellum biogenesis ATPase FlaH
MEVYKMSEDGEKILKFVKEIRKLCHNMSLLLMTVDEQMGSKDWEKAGNTAIADSSASVDIPERWFPETIFRFYINT